MTAINLICSVFQILLFATSLFDTIYASLQNLLDLSAFTSSINIVASSAKTLDKQNYLDILHAMPSYWFTALDNIISIEPGEQGSGKKLSALVKL